MKKFWVRFGIVHQSSNDLEMDSMINSILSRAKSGASRWRLSVKRALILNWEGC